MDPFLLMSMCITKGTYVVLPIMGFTTTCSILYKANGYGDIAAA